MKLFSTILVLIIAIGCSKKAEAPLGQLAESVESFNEAYVIGDTATLAKLITENYVHTNSSWKSFDRNQWLSYMKLRKEKLDQGILVVSNYAMDEYSVETFENTAIVTARITSSGLENGIPFNKSFRISNVWVFSEYQWRRAGFHDSPIQ